MPPPSLSSFADVSLPPMSSSTLASSLFSPDGTSVFALTASGHLGCAWARSGGLKAGFGGGGVIQTKSKHNSCMHLFYDSFGTGSVLTGGGYDFSSTTEGHGTQQCVKLWDAGSGENKATFMGGRGLCRAIAVPGTDMDTVVSTVVSKEEAEEEKENEEAKEERKEDLYADDPTFGNQVDDVAEERRLAKLAKEREARKPKNPNKHSLATFVSGGDDGVVRLFSLATCKMLKSLSPEGGAGDLGAVSALATCSARPSLVLSAHQHKGGSGSPVLLWDATGQVLINQLPEAHLYDTTQMLLSPCGGLLYTAGGADDPTVKEWDLRMMKKLKNITKHDDKVTAMSLVATPAGSHLMSSSKDGATFVTEIRKTGVVRTRLAATVADDDIPSGGWSIAHSLARMRGGAFAGGQERKAKPDFVVVGTDRGVRSFDVSDYIDLERGLGDDKKDREIVAEDEGGGGGKGDKEGNYHRQQEEFWDNFGAVTPEQAAKDEANAKKEERKKVKVEQEKKKQEVVVKTDKYGNEVGSLEYWVAKDAEPKRPKVGDLVVLVGDGGDLEAAAEASAKTVEMIAEERQARIDSLPAEAKQGALVHGKGDIGILLKDDKSGVPFEIFSGVSGQTTWYEELWVEKATAAAADAAESAHGITKASLKAGVSVAGKRREQEEREAKEQQADAEEEEDVSFYQSMMMRGGGHEGKLGWDGEEEAKKEKAEKEKEKKEKKEKEKEKEKDRKEKAAEAKAAEGKEEEDDYNSFSLSKFKPPNPPPSESKSKAEMQAEADRQQSVQDSLNIYRQQKKKASTGPDGKRVSRF